MATYIAILRGINVSGRKPVKMDVLRDLFIKSGFEQVNTYIQSGNVVFQSEKTDTKDLQSIISKKIRDQFGFDIPVFVLVKDDLIVISENNPFIKERKENTDKLHVTFLSEVPSSQTAGKLNIADYLPDEFIIQGRAVYLCCPNGYGRTKLNNNFFESKLKVTATTRNWKTVLELVKLARVLDA
jgi:uncharacterized protein (DUF1697 family)